MTKRRVETADQWRSTGDRRTPSELAIDAYLRTRPGTPEAIKALDCFWESRGVRMEIVSRELATQ